MLALGTENGPCTFNKDGRTTTKNPYSWNEESAFIWIDNPVGSGFSHADSPAGWDHNETQVAADLLRFIVQFLDDHTEYQGRPLYIFGESYAGHYVPSFAYAIHESNVAGKTNISLAGIGIGNGLTDPVAQYDGYYQELAYNYSIKAVGEPRVSLQQYEQMNAAQPRCNQLIQECQDNTGECSDAQEYCNNALFGPYEESGYNPYDIRIKCQVQPLCYDFSYATDFLNAASVQSDLGVNRKWESCNFQVNAGFSSDWMKDQQWKVPALLSSGVRVVVYAGDMDFIVNWLGVQAWTLALKWEGHDQFNAQTPHKWQPEGAKQAYGEARTYQGFTFLRVFNAGHMVPRDQPEAAQVMVNTIFEGKDF